MVPPPILLSEEEIRQIGFGSVGKEVRITRYALFFNPGKIFIGNRVRIDAFAIVSAGEEGIYIGNNVHIAAGAILNGTGGKITMSDFSGVAPYVCLWTSSEVYSQPTLTNPTVSEQFRRQKKGPIYLGRHVSIGTSSVVLPGVHLADGAAVGALSLVLRDVNKAEVVMGVPARTVAIRPLDHLEQLARQYLESIGELPPSGQG
ncbi:MAG: acyltransferase [Thermoguttaceae bacterium]|nr:acyltransferase [Thermoguttaceae bacterium]MDW8037820.1 acyltransferase [Thermoguttaceae bacterium]